MTERPEGHGVSLERLVFFSDSVFAIAITLLALDIRIPHTDASQVAAALKNLVPAIGIYVLTFVVVGLYWVGHHRVFRLIVRFDYTLVWLNMALLLCVAFLPVPNAVFVHNPTSPHAVLFYACTLCATSAASLVLWWYVSSRGRLIAEHASEAALRTPYIRNVTTICVAAVAAIIAFSSTMFAFGLLVAYALISVVTGIRSSKED